MKYKEELFTDAELREWLKYQIESRKRLEHSCTFKGVNMCIGSLSTAITIYSVELFQRLAMIFGEPIFIDRQPDDCNFRYKAYFSTDEMYIVTYLRYEDELTWVA